MSFMLAASLATTALSIGQSYMAYQGQQQQYKQQKKMNEVNQANAHQDMLSAFSDTNRRMSQAEEKAAQDVWDAQRETRKRRARARVAAGEAGVSGSSVEALLSDIDHQGAEYAGDVNQNTDMSLAQLSRAQEGHRATYRNRVAGMPSPIRPNKMALGLQIGSAGLDGYTSYRSMQPRGDI